MIAEFLEQVTGQIDDMAVRIANGTGYNTITVENNQTTGQALWVNKAMWVVNKAM